MLITDVNNLNEMEVKIKMKIIFLCTAMLIGVSACTQLDEYLPRETQCLLYSAVKEAAKEKGISVDDYIAVANEVQKARGEDPLEICQVNPVV